MDIRSFIDINVHWLDDEFTMKKKIVDVLEVKGSKSANDYRSKVDSKLEEFGIKSKTFSFTTDNAPKMKSAFNSSERNGCIAHIDSIAGKTALKAVATYKNLRVKLRKIARKGNKSSKLKNSLEKNQRKRRLTVKTLKQEVKTRFTACNTMTKSFLNDPILTMIWRWTIVYCLLFISLSVIQPNMANIHTCPIYD